jgi:N-acylneuraminate cytidylyltransferase
LDFYEKRGHFYDTVVLLQPTSPLRTATHVQEAMSLYRNDVDMVVSVKESHAPFVLCNENNGGYLEFVCNKSIIRRQDMPKYYEYNGAIYVISSRSLKDKRMSKFDKIIKYVMAPESSVDIDGLFDWQIAEYLMQQKALLDNT